jgi:hypothetical protein
MTTAQKRLKEIQEKRKAFQKEEDKIKSDIANGLSKFLIDANAIDVDIDVLMGGILDVVEKSKQNDKITEVWKLSGEKFRQGQKKRNTQKNNDPSKKVKKNKNDDQ